MILLDRINNRKFVDFRSFIVEQGKTAEFYVQASSIVKFEISFSDASGSSSEQSIDVKRIDESSVKLTFWNWSNPLGTALKEAVPIASIPPNENLFILAASWRIGDINKVDIQFSRGSIENA